jgi:hypothetical protein
VYEALCEFTNTPQDKDIVKLINPEKLSVNQNTLKDTLNSIYDFKQDTVAIANIKNFENYRRNYPIRYEWHHFNSVCLFSEHDIERGIEASFFIQENDAEFKEGAAKEMIGMVCNMLEGTNPEQAKLYRQRLANLISQ